MCDCVAISFHRASESESKNGARCWLELMINSFVRVVTQCIAHANILVVDDVTDCVCGRAC